MSSYLSKSRKDFKPKAPARRPIPAPTRSLSTLSRESSERQAPAPAQSISADQTSASPDTSSGLANGSATPAQERSLTSRSVTLEERGSLEAQRQLSGHNEASEPPAKRRRTDATPGSARNAERGGASALSQATATQTDSGEGRARDIQRADSTGEESTQQVRADALPSRPTPRARSGRRDETRRRELENLAEEVVREAVGEDIDFNEAQPGDAAREGLTTAAAPATAYAAQQPKPARKRRKREPTPDDAEEREIAPTTVTMSDLTRDNRQGRKSTREVRLREMDAELLLLKRERARQQAGEFMKNPEGGLQNDGGGGDGSGGEGGASAEEGRPSGSRDGGEGSGGDAARSSSRASAPEQPQAVVRLAPQVRLVNGQIVQDESSRIVDRHAQHQLRDNDNGGGGGGADADGAVLDESATLEDELSRKVNAGSYLKRERQWKWTDEATALFYDGLRMFGTDFQTISKLFPGRSRRQIKLKFTKEERTAGEFVRRALLDERKEPDWSLFERLSGRSFRHASELEEDLARDRARIEEEERREREAAEAAARERREEAVKASAAASASASAPAATRGSARAAATANGTATSTASGASAKTPATRNTRQRTQQTAASAPAPAITIPSLDDDEIDAEAIDETGMEPPPKPARRGRKAKAATATAAQPAAGKAKAPAAAGGRRGKAKGAAAAAKTGSAKAKQATAAAAAKPRARVSARS